MRRDMLIDQLLTLVAGERALLGRMARYLLPLLLLPFGFALAQMVRSWVGLLAGGLGALLILSQIELFLRPILERVRITSADMGCYLAGRPDETAPLHTPIVPLALPSAAALIGTMAVFFPTILANAAAWQRLLALALSLGAFAAIWQRLAQIVGLLDALDRRLLAARQQLVANSQDNDQALQPGPRAQRPAEHGLLDPATSQRVAGLPMPVLALSPAAQALLRVEAHLLLRDLPAMQTRELIAALGGLAQQAHDDERRHWLLPPVGGKIYLPIAANGRLAQLLGASARRLGMDGGYSATLGTWLLRLPPAHAYAVAGRLIDSLIALGILPSAAILPHHLTIQGELGQGSKLLSLLHLAATPLLFDERPGHAQGDDRPFIMRGGGVLDDMAGRGRHSGPRTDFVDGFIFVHAPGLDAVEHLTAHTINLRIKQVLAFGLLSQGRPPERCAPAERDAADAYARLRQATRALLADYALEPALDIAWLDGRWSEVWPLLAHMSRLKERDPSFLRAAQQLRDAALDELERIAVDATRELRR